MKTSLEEIVVRHSNSESSSELNDPEYYLDLKKSIVETKVADVGIAQNARENKQDLPLYFRGAILKFDFKLVFKKLLPPGSSVILFSAHSTDKRFIASPPPSIWRKIRQFLRSKTENLWLYLTLQKRLVLDLNASQKRDYREIIKDEEVSEPADPLKLESTLKFEEKEDVGASKQILEKSFKQRNYRFFLTDEDTPSYITSMNLDSINFNMAIPSSEALWISLRHSKACCQPLALHLPKACLGNMVYLVAKPAYIHISLQEIQDEIKISKVVEFFRNDNTEASIYPDPKTRYPFITVKKPRENGVQLTFHVKSLREANYLTAEKEIFYLNFLEGAGNKLLNIRIPVLIENKVKG